MEFDYKSLGLKVGLEIHRHLDTKKLFSAVPSQLHDNVDFTFERRLRPTMSELGEIDQAALEEFKRGRVFVYEGNYKYTDLVYIDEEPPHMPDEDALTVALQITYLLHAIPVDEVHFIR